MPIDIRIFSNLPIDSAKFSNDLGRLLPSYVRMLFICFQHTSDNKCPVISSAAYSNKQKRHAHPCQDLPWTPQRLSQVVCRPGKVSSKRQGHICIILNKSGAEMLEENIFYHKHFNKKNTFFLKYVYMLTSFSFFTSKYRYC